MNEIIYILTNEAMPNMCKIGFTNKPLEQRLKDLTGKTEVPLPFQKFYAKRVTKSAKEIEVWLHKLFENDRVNPKREFFRTSPNRVRLALEQIDGEEIVFSQNVVADDKEEIEALQKAQRRDRFNFKSAQIPVGAKLVFIYDESKTCTVLSDINEVEFQGQKLSVSEAARLAYKKEYQIAGTLYWMYEGETLDERRRKIETGE